MKTKLIALVMLMIMSSAIFAESAPLTATDRVKNMSNEEATWRWIEGGAKFVVGAVLTGAGYSAVSYRDNPFGAMVMIPIGIITLIPGVITLGWGGYDLLFGSREYENQYDKLKLASDPAREDQALTYLKEKSAKDKQDRQPSFWNAFGLFSLFETPAEREYNGYLKDRNQAR